MDRRLLVIADPHLGTIEGDVDVMTEFIQTLSPRETTLIYLGDLFHIWVGPTKYHTTAIKQLFGELERFRGEGGVTHLIAGNRDTILPEISSGEQHKGLPFDTISREFLRLPIEDRTIVAFHGDTINDNDKAYLRWRYVIRHPVFEILFKLLPPAFVHRLVLKLESGLKQTNLDLKRTFPSGEWEKFVHQQHQDLSPDLLLVGHFHPESPIEYQVESTKALVVPDWYKQQVYMEILPDFSYQLHRFQPEDSALSQ